MHSARYFAVGPVRELGNDLHRAIGLMGGESPQHFARAHGFVIIEGEHHLRLPAELDVAEAHRRAQRGHARLGAAVALAGEQIIYRELAAAPVAKASSESDPRSPEGFLRIVDQVARALRRAAQGAESDAVRRAIDQLDVDWPHLTDADRMSIVRAANEAIAGVPQTIMPRVHEVLDLEAGRVVRGTRRSVKQTFSLKISSDFTRTDERIAQFVARSQTNFIRDEYGRRQVAFSEKARQIVSRAITQGLGRDEISRQLREAFRNTAANRSAFYWDVVASAFVGRARSLAEVSSYADAGISHYIIVATLDEVTCLPAGVQVATTTGSCPIEQVRPGDWVTSHLGRKACVRAAALSRRWRPFCTIRIPGRMVRATANHPFLVRRNGRLGWVRAADLEPGDHLLVTREE